jgi:RNA polymerase sigma factor (TIGR02999 family)
MPPVGTKAITQLLVDWRDGDQEARNQLIGLVYEELRRLAHSHLRRERQGHTLQTTALVNEAYLELVDQRRVHWQNRAHFFGVAAQLMRRILVEYARRRAALKRGGHAVRISLDPNVGPASERDIAVVALDDALKGLERLDPQQSHIVELRFFGGLTVEETAHVIGVSPRTVKREWRSAKAWLQRELEAPPL